MENTVSVIAISTARNCGSVDIYLGMIMNIRFISSILLVSGLLIFFGVTPSKILEQGSNTWDEFSGDFMAIFNGGAVERKAKEYRVGSDARWQEICDAAPNSTDAEISELEREINRARCETLKNSNVIVLDPEELKQRLLDRKKLME